MKTGIRAQSQVIRGEDPAEFEELVSGYHRQFPAATPLARFLVDTLARSEWQLRRLQTVEARLWEQSLSPETPGLAEAYTRNLDAFTRLHRRIEALERSYYRALRQLQQLQNDESAGDDDSLAMPALLPDRPAPLEAIGAFSTNEANLETAQTGRDLASLSFS